MAKTTLMRIRCLHCQHWFPSPLFFKSSRTFDASALFSNRVHCPSCGKLTACNKENFHARFEDGGFVGVNVTFD